MRQLCAMALVMSVMTACPPTTPKPTVDAGKPPECETRADCAAGKVCSQDKQCVNCDSSGQCSVKESCDTTTELCVLREGWGTDCAKNEDCQAGSWCKQGLCQDRSQVSLCASGMNSDCPQGERCNQVTTVCEEDLGCSTNDDCSAGEACNTGNRQCVPRCTVETQGTVCAGGEKCAVDHCVQCTEDADCGPGLVCDSAGKCTTGDRCYSDRDCRIPLACFVQTGACLPKAPPCISNDNCLANQLCDVGSGRCVPRTCQPDRYEPNNDDLHGFGVAAGVYRDLTLCTGDSDWYAVTLARGDQLGVNVDADPFSENAFSTVIKDDSGRTLAGGHFLVSYIAPLPAKYFVVMSSTDMSRPYDVTFLLSRGTPCDDDSHEPNDGSTQALALNTTTQVEGAICPQDQDWFRVTVPIGKGLTASLSNYDSSKGLLRLCVLGSDGMTVASCSEDVQPAVTLSAALAGGNSYFVRVLGSTERIANPYTLNVEYP